MHRPAARLFLALLTAVASGASAAAGGADRVAQLRSEDLATRLEAANALGALGPQAADAARPLADLLSDPYWDVRMAAAEALAAVGRPAVPALVRKLQGDDYWATTWAARALGRMGGRAPEAIPALVELLSDPSRDIRAAAMQALERIGHLDAVADAVAKARNDEDRRVRRAAMFALWTCGKAGLPHLVRELQALPEAGHGAQRLAVESARAAGPDRAVPLLVAALDVRAKSCRRWALEILEWLGASALPAVPAVVAIIESDPSDASRVGAMEALVAIAPPEEALPRVIRGLADPNASVAAESGAALRRLGKRAVPALVEALGDPRRQVQAKAVATLAEMGPAATPAVPALEKLAAGGDFVLAMAAREALKQVAPSRASGP